MTARFSRIWILLPLACLFLPACDSEGSSGGNPVEPLLPTITAIEPSDAAPGDRITIRGTGLAGEGVTVTFDGVPAELISTTAASLLAVVPDVPDGDRSVIITASGRASAPFRYNVTPAQVPTILGIGPASAYVGDNITITGSNFRAGLQEPANTVLVGGIRAFLVSATASRIVAVVPPVVRGTTSVVVMSGGRTSAEFQFGVLHASPVITSVAPNPARSGLTITIDGRHLAGFGNALLLDGEEVPIRPLFGSTQIVAKLSAANVGRHTLQVRVEDDVSEAIPLEVDDFNATGTYDVRSVVLESHSGGSSCPAQGTARLFQINLTDNRPSLSVGIGPDGLRLNGSVSSGGEIRASRASGNFFLGTFRPVASIDGHVIRHVDGRFEIDAMVHRFIPCGTLEHVTGVKR